MPFVLGNGILLLLAVMVTDKQVTMKKNLTRAGTSTQVRGNWCRLFWGDGILLLLALVQELQCWAQATNKMQKKEV